MTKHKVGTQEEWLANFDFEFAFTEEQMATGRHDEY
jgi:hypothetical protein